MREKWSGMIQWHIATRADQHIFAKVARASENGFVVTVYEETSNISATVFLDDTGIDSLLTALNRAKGDAHSL